MVAVSARWVGTGRRAEYLNLEYWWWGGSLQDPYSLRK